MNTKIKTKELSTPVVFIIFNRPDLAQKVFEAIRQAKPKRLFIIADGPRFPEERELCLETRKVIQSVDWDCKLSTNISEINLGFGKRIVSGLNWVFSQVEEAIILEDDCLPSPAFFYFCQETLEKYRLDDRVMNISGTDRRKINKTLEYSYYFTVYPCTWGWATWKRAWQLFDGNLNTYPKLGSKATDSLDSELEKKWWRTLFKTYYNLGPRSLNYGWDWQWYYSCMANGSLSVNTSQNLVANIGFGRPDATTSKRDRWYMDLPTVSNIGEIKHAPVIATSKEIDSDIFNNYFMAIENKHRRSFRQKLSQTFIPNHYFGGIVDIFLSVENKVKYFIRYFKGKE